MHALLLLKIKWNEEKTSLNPEDYPITLTNQVFHLVTFLFFSLAMIFRMYNEQNKLSIIKSLVNLTINEYRNNLTLMQTF